MSVLEWCGEHPWLTVLFCLLVDCIVAKICKTIAFILGRKGNRDD